MENTAQPKSGKWYYGIVAVMSALILLGPFAFPLLWKSPRFNLTWKILLTAVFTAATVYCLAAAWQIVALVLQEFKRAGLM